MTFAYHCLSHRFLSAFAGWLINAFFILIIFSGMTGMNITDPAIIISALTSSLLGVLLYMAVKNQRRSSRRRGDEITSNAHHKDGNKDIGITAEYLETVLEQSPNGFIFFDHDGEVRFINSQAETIITGLVKDTVSWGTEDHTSFKNRHNSDAARFLAIVRPTSSHQAPPGSSGASASIDRKASIKDALKTIHNKMISSDGRAVLVKTKATDCGVVMTLSPMESLKANKNEDTSHAIKMQALGQFAGGIAHDFNNLLSIIDGYARMSQKKIEQSEIGAEEVLNYIGRIRLANRRGASLTRQLLTFGQQHIASKEIIDIGSVIEEQRQLLQPILTSSVDLTLNLDRGLFIDVSTENMTQIIVNLVMNAVDAMPHGGRILIEGHKCEAADLPVIIPRDKRQNDFVCLVVTDTGRGMDKEILNQIFDPFFTTKSKAKGTGLGLSIVYGLVKQAEGYIDVLSVPESGATFRLYFPLKEASEHRRQKKKIIRNPDSGPRFEGFTALVAEDEPDLLLVVSNMLEDMGMTVLQAADGDEALERQDEYEGDIDLLLTDVVMPNLGGIKLATLVQDIRPETHVIYMSGYPASGSLARIDVPDGASLLAKPIEYEALAVFLSKELRLPEERAIFSADTSDIPDQWHIER